MSHPLAPPNVAFPARVTLRRIWFGLLVLLLTIAPLPPTPAPDAVIGWLLLNFWPFTSSVAPLLTVTLAEAVPSAATLPACSVPWATMIRPANALLDPFKATMLPPFWVTVPEPEMTLGTAIESLRPKTS